MENTKTFTKVRKTYGVYIDLLGDYIAYANKKRVESIRKQYTLIEKDGQWVPRKTVYIPLEQAAEQSYQAALQKWTTMMQRNAQVGLAPSWKEPQQDGHRFHNLSTAAGATFSVYQYQHVENEVNICLAESTPVYVFSPYKNPDMVHVTSKDEWYQLLNAERESNKQYHLSDEYAKWQVATQYALKFIKETETPWLGTTKLKDFIGKFSCLEEFLFYAQGEVARLEEAGEWDLELTASVVMNEKASTAHTISTKGTDKGRRTFWCKDNPDKVDYWYNLEVLPVDICTKFLHLTFLASTKDKAGKPFLPLRRIMAVGAEFDGTEMWRGTALEDMVRTTPLYEDQLATHERPAQTLEELLSIMPNELQEVVAAMGIKTIKSLGYEAALKAIRFNLNNN